MPIGPRDRPHLRVEGGGENEPYTSPKLTIAGLPPARARAQHAAKLRQSIDAALAGARTSIAAREPGIAEGEPGFYLQFDVPAEQKSALDSLENIPKAIELVAVKSAGEDQQTVSATVFVPESAEDFFQNRIEAYRTKKRTLGSRNTKISLRALKTFGSATRLHYLPIIWPCFRLPAFRNGGKFGSEMDF